MARKDHCRLCKSFKNEGRTKIMGYNEGKP